MGYQIFNCSLKLQTSNTLQNTSMVYVLGWKRDLVREGIESNPGPDDYKYYIKMKLCFYVVKAASAKWEDVIVDRFNRVEKEIENLNPSTKVDQLYYMDETHVKDFFANHQAKAKEILEDDTVLGYVRRQIEKFEPKIVVKDPVSKPKESIDEKMDEFINLVETSRQVKQYVIDRIFLRWKGLAFMTINSQDTNMARLVYDRAEQMVGSSTKLELQEQLGIYVSVPLNERHGESLLYCFNEKGQPLVLKRLYSAEIKRLKALTEADLQSDKSTKFCQWITRFNFIEDRKVLIMPFYPGLLEFQLNHITLPRFWDQMKEALKFLHSNGFAHNDIKPSNIAFTKEGNFTLIDLGSVARFGNKTSSTRAYVIKELFLLHLNEEGYVLKGKSTSREILDWFMLAFTMYRSLVDDSKTRGCKHEEGRYPGEELMENLNEALERIEFPVIAVEMNSILANAFITIRSLKEHERKKVKQGSVIYY